jgi:hypothetical protein
MDQELVQRTRYILRARFRRAQTCPTSLFSATCKQLHHWLSSHPVVSGHIHGVRRELGNGANRVVQIGLDLAARRAKLTDQAHVVRDSYEPGFYEASTLADHAAVCLSVLDAIASDDTPRGDEFLVRCLGEYLTGDDHIKFDDALQTLRDVAIDGLFEFLDEHLDARNVVLALLVKYKQRAEWFQRAALRALAGPSDGTRGGERSLAMNLYEYLLDQSIEFFVEPVSGSGEADVVLREPSGKYVIVDAKHIKQDDSPSHIKRKLASGFHQVARYCDDYHEGAGHLVVFSESPRRLSVELEESDGWRFLRLGSRLVYYTDIWIADSPSASKLGKAEEISVSKADLLTDSVDAETGA